MTKGLLLILALGLSAPACAAAAGPELAPLTAEGWGPLRIGMTSEQVVAALGGDSEPDASGGPEPEQCDMWRPQRAPEGLMVMIIDGRLRSIWLVDEAAIRTDRGLGIGSTAADVRRIYGSAIAAEPHHYQGPTAEYLVFWARGGRATRDREDPDARGIKYETDEQGRVTTIAAGGQSIEYVEGCS